MAQRLAVGCHNVHGTKLYLEGQSAVLQKKSTPINFKLAIEAAEAGTMDGRLSYEIIIEVLEDNTNAYILSLSLWCPGNSLTQSVEQLVKGHRGSPGSDSPFLKHQVFRTRR